MNTHSLNLELDSSQFAWIADNASLSLTGDLTLEAWTKPESTTINGMIVGKMYISVNKRSYSLFLDTNDTLRFFISSDGIGGTAASTTDTITTGVWTHVAVTYDASAGTCQFYINGSASQSGSSLDTSIHDNDSRFSIGARDTEIGGVNFYDGLVDEVRAWNDIRSAGEVSANYLKQLVGDEAGLVANYEWDGESYLDKTANNNDLTPSGSPVFSTDVPFTGVTGTSDRLLVGMGGGKKN